MTGPIPTPASPAPDVLRCAYMEVVVTDLAASRAFYVDVLGLHVTEEDADAVYLRSTEEFIHHNLVLRAGPVAAVAAFSYRVRTPEDLDKAVAFYTELGCRVERNPNGYNKGIGDSVRVEDPLGFPYEFFYDVEHVERRRRRVDHVRPPAFVGHDLRCGHVAGAVGQAGVVPPDRFEPQWLWSSDRRRLHRCLRWCRCRHGADRRGAGAVGRRGACGADRPREDPGRGAHGASPAAARSSGTRHRRDSATPVPPRCRPSARRGRVRSPRSACGTTRFRGCSARW